MAGEVGAFQQCGHAEGRAVNEEDVARLSPARYEHINPYGNYRFEVEEWLSRFGCDRSARILNARLGKDCSFPRCYRNPTTAPYWVAGS